MINILVATQIRGFLKNLFINMNEKYRFDHNSIESYEKLDKKKIFLNKIARGSIMDQLGFVRQIKVSNMDSDLNFSYNKFLDTDTNYVIYLENPYALVNYSTKRYNTILGRKKINQLLRAPNLKGIICLSKACQQNLESVYDIPEDVFIEQIYPFLPNTNYDMNNIAIKSNKDEINCLYISSRFTLKGGADILESFERLSSNGHNNIKLKIITPINDLNQEYKDIIDNNENIELIDYNLSKSELDEIYKETNILLNPARLESFGLVILEAMKHGVAVITTDLYAIPEMVIDEKNGFLVEPKYKVFENNTANDTIWYNREKTIYSDFIDDNIVNFLCKKLVYLHNNREILTDFSKESVKISNNNEFSSNVISEKWEKVFDRALQE